MVEAIKVILATMDQDSTVFEFTESKRCDEFIPQACQGDFSFAIIYPNVYTRPRLEHSLVAIKTAKAARAALIVAL